MMRGRRLGGVHGDLVAVVMLLLFLIQSATGCSLAFVKGPPEGPPPDERRLRQPPPLTCTTSSFLPYADGVGAIVPLFGALTVIALGRENAVALASALVGGLFTALLLGSASVGATRVSECRQAKAEERLHPPPPTVAAPPTVAPPEREPTPPPPPLVPQHADPE